MTELPKDVITLKHIQNLHKKTTEFGFDNTLDKAVFSQCAQRIIQNPKIQRTVLSTAQCNIMKTKGEKHDADILKYSSDISDKTSLNEGLLHIEQQLNDKIIPELLNKREAMEQERCRMESAITGLTNGLITMTKGSKNLDSNYRDNTRTEERNTGKSDLE